MSMEQHQINAPTSRELARVTLVTVLMMLISMVTPWFSHALRIPVVLDSEQRVEEDCR